MKIFAGLAFLSLIAIAVAGDYLWRRWIAKTTAAREDRSGKGDRRA